MYLELDGDGPLYRQLIRALKHSVTEGRLVAGAKLPTTRALADELALSRNTVRAAYDQLIAEGFFNGRVGSGSYVATVVTRPSRAAPPVSLPPQSRYAKRIRAIRTLDVGQRHRGLRYNLQYGEPIHDLAAIDVWRRELSHAAAHTKLAYPGAAGLPVLREALADYLLRRRGISASVDDIVIVSGTQQALSLTAALLIDEGDCVAMEDPFYFGALQVFEAHGARVLPVAADGEGLLVKSMRRRAPKLIAVTPAHQFPGGSVMSMPRRQELLAFAEHKQCWIFEDDYDSEFRYDAKPIPALKAIDSADRVIYAGSFSKVMFPSLRLGYMVVPAALRRDFRVAKRLADFGCPAIEQAAMARLISGGGFERHLRRVVQIARKRRQTLIEGLERVGKGHFRIDGSDAGMHVVAWLPRMTMAQCADLIDIAAERGLGLHPIAPHFHHPPAEPGLLFGYAGLSAVEIEAAMRVLGACITAFLKVGLAGK